MNISNALNLLELLQAGSTITQQMIKKAYKAASLKFHPDRNPAGNLMMQAINEAYTFLKSLDHDIEGEHQDQEKSNIHYCDELNAVINALIKLGGLNLEVCGNWLWIDGDTKPHKEIIKSVGCKWHRKKVKWSYHPADWSSCSRGSWDMDKIRSVHGSQNVHGKARPQLN